MREREGDSERDSERLRVIVREREIMRGRY